MATLDDDLAKAVTEGFRQAQIDIANQDLILSGTGDVTVTRADGSKKTGPSWSKLIAQAGAAGASAAAAKTSEANALASKNAAALSATNAATSEDNALASKNAAKTSETNAKTSENNSKTSENNAGVSASSAAASLAAAQKLTSVPYEAPPYPDVWLPLNDDMRLKEGIAPYDTLTISGQVLELPTKSALLTRSTTGTYYDKSGLMKLADINEPRLDKQGLLIESGATNLYTYSETIGAGSGVTATNNAGVSPMGDNTMSLIIENTANTEHYAGDRNIVLTANTVYCFSVFVKAHTNSRNLYLRIASGSTAGVFFDPVTGAWSGNGTGAAYADRGFEDIGNGIYRVWITFTAAASQSTVIRIQLANGVTASYTGDGKSGLYVWGAQLEESPSPTSYIKTISATVTRAPDLWDMSSINAGYRTLADKFKRTVAFEFVSKLAPSTSYAEVLRNGGVSNDIICRLLPSNRLASYRSSGGITVNMDQTLSGVYVHKVVGDVVTIYWDGKNATATSLPVGTTQTPTRLGNNTPNSVAKFVYYIRNLRIWHRELTENQINGLR